MYTNIYIFFKNVKLATPTPARVPTLAHQLAFFDPTFYILDLPSFQSIYLGTVSEVGPGKRLTFSRIGAAADSDGSLLLPSMGKGLSPLRLPPQQASGTRAQRRPALAFSLGLPPSDPHCSCCKSLLILTSRDFSVASLIE